MEWSEHDLEDSDWDQIDSYEAPRHQMGQNKKDGEGGVQGGYSGSRGYGLRERYHFAILGF